MILYAKTYGSLDRNKFGLQNIYQIGIHSPASLELITKWPDTI
jgi:hypothetical protein